MFSAKLNVFAATSFYVVEYLKDCSATERGQMKLRRKGAAWGFWNFQKLKKHYLSEDSKVTP